MSNENLQKKPVLSFDLRSIKKNHNVCAIMSLRIAIQHLFEGNKYHLNTFFCSSQTIIRLFEKGTFNDYVENKWFVVSQSNVYIG